MKMMRSAIPFARGLAACALLLAAVTCARAQTPRHLPKIEKIEPPSWWAGHTVNPVRLLVRGTDLRLVRLRAAEGAPFEVSNQTVNADGTYIFADLRIDQNAAPGSYDLLFSQ